MEETIIKNINLLENKFKKKKVGNRLSVVKVIPQELTLEELDIQSKLIDINIMSNKLNNYVLTINKYLKYTKCDKCKYELGVLLKNW